MIRDNQRFFSKMSEKAAELYFRVGQITVLHFIQWQYQYLRHAVSKGTL